MPTCHDCGNTVEFIHHVKGDEVRTYDDNGILLGVDDQSLETQAVTCNECGSPDVDLDQ